MCRCFSDIIVKGLSGPKTIYRKNNSASARRLMEMSLNVVLSYKMRGVPAVSFRELARQLFVRVAEAFGEGHERNSSTGMRASEPTKTVK
jgi:hypothetical protein